jgi:integral membrane protein
VSRLPVTLFRVAAVAEAFSWAGLLVGMFLKYGPVDNEIGVRIFGPIHGGLFLLYLVSVLLVRTPLRLGFRRTILGLAAAIPPFTTVWFERSMLRRAARLSSSPAPDGARDSAPAGV